MLSLFLNDIWLSLFFNDIWLSFSNLDTLFSYLVFMIE